MTIEEVYNQVKAFTPSERARLIEMIVQIDSDAPSAAHIEEPLESKPQAGAEGASADTTTDAWDQLRNRVSNPFKR